MLQYKAMTAAAAAAAAVAVFLWCIVVRGIEGRTAPDDNILAAAVPATATVMARSEMLLSEDYWEKDQQKD